MQNTSTTSLARDCAAIRIPFGESIVLPAGTPVFVTQTLGGTFTVRADGGLFRIAGQDADALGLEQPTAARSDNHATPTDQGDLDEKMIWDALRTCFDPEIPVNIVDLGLVYDLRVEPAAPRGSRVSVKMTLTAQGCGMGSVIADDARQKLLVLPGVEEADVEIVWDPPWHPSMISPEGKRILGLE